MRNSSSLEEHFYVYKVHPKEGAIIFDRTLGSEQAAIARVKELKDRFDKQGFYTIGSIVKQGYY